MRLVCSFLVAILFYPWALALAQQTATKKEIEQTVSVSTLRRDIKEKKINVEKVISGKQKEKLSTICQTLKKISDLKRPNANQVEAVRTSVAKVFNQANAEQVDFFSVYVLDHMYSEGGWDPPSVLRKQQQIIQMLSNVGKVLKDTSASTIRKIG